MTKEEAIRHIRTEYDRLDNITGISSCDVYIRLSNRMTRTLGSFREENIKKNVPMEIVFSEKIINDPNLFLDVIRHEYAHMLVYKRYPRQRHAHDIVWRNACIEIGCTPKATRRVEDISIPIKSMPNRYKVTCLGCKAESFYKKESKTIKIILKKEKGRVVCRNCQGQKFLVRKIG